MSIIVPAFNAQATIAETMDSVKAQTYRPIELIVVDDGSSDSTWQIVQSLAQSRPSGDVSYRIRIERQQNAGAPKARNRGACLSRGEFIAFLDADDVFHSDKISQQVTRLMNRPDWAFCYGPVAVMEAPDQVPYGNRAVEWPEATIRQLAWPFFSTPGPLFRRAFLASVGPWDEDVPGCDDWELHSRMMGLKPEFGWVPDARAFFRRGGDSQKRASVRNFKSPRGADWRALDMRARQLRSAIVHAPIDFAQTDRFRRVAAWETVRLARTMIGCDALSEADSLFREAAKLGRATPLWPLCTSADALFRWGLPRVSWALVTLVEWTLYRSLAIAARVKTVMPARLKGQ